jgi:hypothetical protein
MRPSGEWFHAAGPPREPQRALRALGALGALRRWWTARRAARDWDAEWRRHEGS